MLRESARPVTQNQKFKMLYLYTLPLKPEQNSAYTLLLDGRIASNAIVLLQSDSTKVLPLQELNNTRDIHEASITKYQFQNSDF